MSFRCYDIKKNMIVYDNRMKYYKDKFYFKYYKIKTIYNSQSNKYYELLKTLCSEYESIKMKNRKLKTEIRRLKHQNKDLKEIKPLFKMKVTKFVKDRQKIDLCCKICMDNEINTVCLDCCHACVCSNCALNIIECPICRKAIKKGFCELFIS